MTLDNKERYSEKKRFKADLCKWSKILIEDDLVISNYYKLDCKRTYSFWRLILRRLVFLFGIGAFVSTAINTELDKNPQDTSRHMHVLYLKSTVCYIIQDIQVTTMKRPNHGNQLLRKRKAWDRIDNCECKGTRQNKINPIASNYPDIGIERYSRSPEIKSKELNEKLKTAAPEEQTKWQTPDKQKNMVSKMFRKKIKVYYFKVHHVEYHGHSTDKKNVKKSRKLGKYEKMSDTKEAIRDRQNNK